MVTNSIAAKLHVAFAARTSADLLSLLTGNRGLVQAGAVHRVMYAKMPTMQKCYKKLMCLQLPPVTRAYITLSFLTTAGCALDVSFSASAAQRCR